MSDTNEKSLPDGIAIVGMAGRFPGAGSVAEFWRNLRDGVESVSFFSDDELLAGGVAPSLLANPGYVKAKAVLAGVAGFDAWFFGFTPREAEITDPQHRLFLECAWEALEDAGYDPARYAGLIGLYAGAGVNTYLLRNLSSHPELLDATSAFQTSIHNKGDHLTTRVAYLLDLRGPCVTVQTACSTSLVAVSLACQSLLNYQCDMALAGGVTITLPQQSGYLYQEGGIGSPDGHCRAFDARAAGTLDGNGAGIVVLKRLEEALADGDTIHAVIKGTAINNDGSHKAGYTAPGLDAQAEVIATAQMLAGCDADSISYVEAHGTATPLGDPIEIAALTKAFRLSTTRNRFCAIGSVKTNIGHLDAAAGVAGLIKTTLALKHGVIPPSLHFTQPNPRIDFASTPFYVNAGRAEWSRGATPRRAGVSSFGIGGTNAHVVLEEAPVTHPSVQSRPWHLLLLSAKTGTALETASDNLAEFLEADAGINLADVAHTLQVGRRRFNHRRVVLCRDTADAARALRTLDQQRVASRFQEPVHRPVTFMFPGQGTQYAGMGAELYREEPVFRQHVDACAELLAPHLGTDLRDLLYPGEEQREAAAQRLDQTAYTQPALFVIEYALARLWMELGVRPTAMIGHSIGEYVAACLAGVLSLEDALALVAFRGQLIQSLPGGAMMAVTMPEAELLPWLDEALSLAAVNGPTMCVAAGTAEAVAALEKRLSAQGVVCRRLRTSHAFHSRMMHPLREAFTERFKQVTLRPPEIPYISNLTGTWITAAEATDAHYWVQHLCQTVRFADGVAELFKEPETVLLEVGPGRSLKSATRWHPAKAPAQVVETSLPHRDEQQPDFAFWLSSLGKLWLAGVEIDWQRFSAHEHRRRIPLPTYPFERKRYWVEDRSTTDAVQPSQDAARKRADVAEWFHVPVWKESVAPNVANARRGEQVQHWLVFADDAGLSQQIVRQLEEQGQKVFTVSAGTEFGDAGERDYRINPTNRQDYVALLEDLEQKDGFPDLIFHLWNVTASGADSAASEKLLHLGFYSLLFLAQALGGRKSVAPLRLTVVSNALQDITGEEPLSPEKATLLGPCKVIPREYPQINCRSVDIALAEAGSWQQERLIGQLIMEAATGGTETVVAYRGSRRWVQDFEPVLLPAMSVAGAQPPPLLREGGVYLITGGLGGIGLTLAEDLAHNFRAKLVLCGRSPFPDAASWDEWLATHDHRDATSERIRKLRRFEEAGAEVMVARADVTSAEQMSALVARALERFGQINGVIHAAGIAGGGLMQLRTTEQTARVLAPKVNGTLVVEAACAGLRLDFFALCSSLSSLVGWAGQVDYCAANAFLDAFAHDRHRRGGAFTVAINWGEWLQLGMAADDPLAQRGERTEARQFDHPLLEKCVIGANGEEVYSTEFNVNKHWVLDEHRLIGNAVIPGVAYFEMVRAALGARANGKVIELRDVYLVEPLRVRDDQTREVRLILQPDADGFSFSVESGLPGEENGAARRKYALGSVRLADPSPARRYDINELIARCNVREETFAEEEREDDLGPRWQNVKRAYVGAGEVFTVLELAPDFAADLEKMKYHPALMDRAVGRAKEYLVTDEYLPVSYQSLRIHGPIPRKIHSHARLRPGHNTAGETLTWDTVVADEQGLVLVEIEGFVQKRINDAASTIKSYVEKDAPGSTSAYAAPVAAAPEAAGSRPDEREEMLPAEGVEAFRRILAHRVMPQVAVSVRDLRASIAQADVVAQQRLQEEAEKPRAARALHPRPDLPASYAAPYTEMEQRIAATWRESLGLERVGIHDNFFELGGDSVQALLILASLNKTGLQLSPQQFFQYQTIAELAAMVVANDSPATDSDTADARFTKAGTDGSAPFDFPLAALDEEQFDKLSLLLAEADEETDSSQPETQAVRAETISDERDPAVARIEALLRQHSSVRQAVVISNGHAPNGERQNGNGLAAFIVLNQSNREDNGRAHSRPIQFSLFYFANDDAGAGADRYRLYLEGARFADQNNFAAVWTPERHFHSSGGLYPNPSVLSAALATFTQNVRLRAGSVVMPLHHPLRVVEEWAVVDNLSRGRVGLSFTSGWIPNDFAFFPERFANKRDEMFNGIEQVRSLWRGEPMRVRDGAGNDVDVKIFPRPVQPELPVWLTCSGDPEMFVRAGKLGVNVLTALLTQSIEETAAKIALYREARAAAGHDPATGHVTLMAHTFVGNDAGQVREQVRGPLCDYLKSHVGLVKTMARSLDIQSEPRLEEHLDDLVSFAFERYYQTASLLGTPDECLRTVERLQAIGVDEIACFIDFMTDAQAVMDSLPHLRTLKDLAEKMPVPSNHNAGSDAPAQLLSNHLRERLSGDLVPASLLILDDLPLNADGTIDRRALASML
ncbi:MAG: MupA/Atu3671 family FMN-dependent luciferase-like monooxygenase [Acidobacteriota bacterium]